MKSRLFCCLSAVVLCAGIVLAHGNDKRYTIAAIDTLGGAENFAYAINNRGDVVGLSRTAGDASNESFLFSSGRVRALSPLNSGALQTVGPTSINDKGLIASGVIRDGVYVPAIYDSRRGRITPLGSLGGVTTFGFSGVAAAVNDDGQAVGHSYLDDVNHHAFIYSDGVMRDLGSFGGQSAALDINDSAEVVGFAADSVGGVAHAFVYRDGVMTEIDPFGGPNNESSGEGINSHGRVVGWGVNADGTAFRGFVHSANRGIVDVGTLRGGQNSFAYAINDRNQVVGVSDYSYRSVCPSPQGPVRCVKSGQHGFLYERGEMTDVNSLIDSDLGWDLQWVFDINDEGQIIGYGVLNGRFRAFVMTPESGRHGRGDNED